MGESAVWMKPVLPQVVRERKNEKRKSKRERSKRVLLASAVHKCFCDMLFDIVIH